MKVFISWSGEPSKLIALALRDWLPSVLQHVEPFVSEEDIETGARWAPEIAEELEQSRFGIVCLTPDNWQRPWLNFEAGALSHSVRQSRVAPFLVGLEPNDLKGPLSQFQATVQPTQPNLLRLVRSINSVSDQPLDGERVERAVDRWWPELESALAAVNVSRPESETQRGETDILNELLAHVRALRRQPSNLALNELGNSACRTFGSCRRTNCVTVTNAGNKFWRVRSSGLA
jgi:hypothetical protein